LGSTLTRSLLLPCFSFHLLPFSSASNRLITAKDHSAVQINFANVDEKGVYTGDVTTFAICGFLRQQGRSDNSVNRLAQDAGLLKHTYKF